MNQQKPAGHPQGHRDEVWPEQPRIVSLARSDQNTQRARNNVPVNERQPWVATYPAGGSPAQRMADTLTSPAVLR